MNKRVLKPEYERFCIAYTSPGDFGGIAYRAYAEAYGIEIPTDDSGKVLYSSNEYRGAQASGSRLLLRKDIQERIKEIYLEYLNNEDIDARIAEIAKRGKDTDSLNAIKIYNDLKQRVTKKLDVTTAGRPLAGLSDEELRALAE